MRGAKVFGHFLRCGLDSLSGYGFRMEDVRRKELHAKLGQPAVEHNFLAKA